MNHVWQVEHHSARSMHPCPRLHTSIKYKYQDMSQNAVLHWLFHSYENTKYGKCCLRLIVPHSYLQHHALCTYLWTHTPCHYVQCSRGWGLVSEPTSRELHFSAIDRQTDRQRERDSTDRQTETDRQTGRQTDRKREGEVYLSSPIKMWRYSRSWFSPSLQLHWLSPDILFHLHNVTDLTLISRNL